MLEQILSSENFYEGFVVKICQILGLIDKP